MIESGPIAARRWAPTRKRGRPGPADRTRGPRLPRSGHPPDFSPYATHTVTFDRISPATGALTFTEANNLAGLSEAPEGYTWHHCEDTQTMMLVPSDMPDAIRHAGGVSIMKGRT
jgi:hypothetical protein